MSVVTTRLVFLAFLGLTGCIIYNALYLQELHNAAVLPAGRAPGVPLPSGPIHVNLRQRPSRRREHRSAAIAGEGGASAARHRRAARACRARLCVRTRRRQAGRQDRSGDLPPIEKEHGLPVTGVATDELLRHILLGRPWRRRQHRVSCEQRATRKSRPPPSDEATVKQVQQILADLGYAPGPLDGTMGDETQRAISAFQRDRKIAQNGRITPELLREIKRVTGRDLAATAPRP